MVSIPSSDLSIMDGGAEVTMFVATSLIPVGKIPQGISAGVKYISGTSKALQILDKGESVWKLGAFERGRKIENALGGMGNNFPTIDKFVKNSKDIATSITSIKSIDIFAKSYQGNNAIYNQVMKYVNSLAGFQTTTWGGTRVIVNSSTNRILELAIPPGATSTQLAQINKAIADAAKQGITVVTKVID